MSDVAKLRLTRERDREVVNGFLEHPDVDHALGGVPGERAAFGARQENGELVAVCVLGRPYSRFIDPREEVLITRLAALPSRPANTGSWIISRARKWAFLEGYDRITALAGIADNEGVVYKAAGFELAEGYPKVENGEGWGSREGRRTHVDYVKRRWISRVREEWSYPDSVDEKYRDQAKVADLSESQISLEEWST